jgi:glycogen operon protein
VYLAGEALTETDARGRPVKDENFLVLFNAHHEELAFRLPGYTGRWRALVDTGYEDGLAPEGIFEAGANYALKARSLALLAPVTA